MRKRKTKTKDGGLVLHGKMGTHSSGTFVFRNASQPPEAGERVEVVRLEKFEGAYFLGDRDWDRVKVDAVLVNDPADPLQNFVVMHYI